MDEAAVPWPRPRPRPWGLPTGFFCLSSAGSKRSACFVAPCCSAPPLTMASFAAGSAAAWADVVPRPRPRCGHFLALSASLAGAFCAAALAEARCTVSTGGSFGTPSLAVGFSAACPAALAEGVPRPRPRPVKGGSQAASEDRLAVSAADSFGAPPRLLACPVARPRPPRADAAAPLPRPRPRPAGGPSDCTAGGASDCTIAGGECFCDGGATPWASDAKSTMMLRAMGQLLFEMAPGQGRALPLEGFRATRNTFVGWSEKGSSASTTSSGQ